MKRMLFFILSLTLVAFGLMSCGEPTEHMADTIVTPSETQSVTITVALPTDDGIRVAVAPNLLYPDGLTITNDGEYADVVTTIIQSGYKINFVFNDEVQARIAEDLPADSSEELAGQKNAVIYLPWSYVLSYDYKPKDISCKCFAKKGYFVTIRLNKGSSQVFDMHATAWTSGGKVCFGLYESVSWWCTSICSPSYNDILYAIYYAALAVGLSAYIAWMVAYIMAPIVIALLAI